MESVNFVPESRFASRRGLLIRLLLTAIVTACFVMIVVFPRGGTLPFQTQAIGAHHLVIMAKPGYTLPKGLSAGMRIAMPDQTFAARVILQMGYGPEGLAFPLLRSYRKTRTTVNVKMVKPHIRIDPHLLAGFLTGLLLVLGLVTLWWGRDVTAWGLSVFAFSVVVNAFLSLSFPVDVILPSVLVNSVLVAPVIVLSLYVTALSLVHDALGRRARLIFHGALVATLIGATGFSVAANVSAILFGNLILMNNPWQMLSVPLFLVALSLPVIAMMFGYRNCTDERRLRIRWISWSLALFVCGVTWINLVPPTVSWMLGLWWVVEVVSISALLYAVLRRRVVVLSFAVNRAIAFSLGVGLVVALFTLLQVVIENTAISQKAGMFITVVVSVAMGVGFDVARERVKRLVELVFFRSQYQAEEALKRFSAHCHYIQSPTELLDRTVDEVLRNTRAGGVALYERARQGYRLLRHKGGQTFPALLGQDDPLFVALRAERREQDLDLVVPNTIGSNGYAFPMIITGELVGALVCGMRTEQYTSAERELLSRLAHEVVNALVVIRARENEDLVERLAVGMEDVGALRERARQLHQARHDGVDPALRSNPAG